LSSPVQNHSLSLLAELRKFFMQHLFYDCTAKTIVLHKHISYACNHRPFFFVAPEVFVCFVSAVDQGLFFMILFSIICQCPYFIITVAFFKNVSSAICRSIKSATSAREILGIPFISSCSPTLYEPVRGPSVSKTG